MASGTSRVSAKPEDGWVGVCTADAYCTGRVQTGSGELFYGSSAPGTSDVGLPVTMGDTFDYALGTGGVLYLKASNFCALVVQRRNA